MEHILSNALIFSKILFCLKHSSNSCFVLVSVKLEGKICVSLSVISSPNAADLTGGRGQGVMRWGAEINTAEASLTHLLLWGLIPTRPQQLPGLGTPALCGSRRCVCVRERERETRKWIGENMFWSVFWYYDSWKCMYVWYESYIHTNMQTVDRYYFEKRFPVNLN